MRVVAKVRVPNEGVCLSREVELVQVDIVHVVERRCGCCESVKNRGSTGCDSSSS